MNFVSTAIVALLLNFSAQALADGPQAAVDVTLTPAGSFQAQTDEIVGEASMKGDTVSAEKIIVKLKNLKTGIAMRDKHTRDKYLETGKFPEAILTKAVGKNGKGTGMLKIKNIERAVAGSYSIKGGLLVAEFPIKLSEYGITGVKYMGVGVDDEVKLHVAVPVKNK
jgi:polyisoprenoid-binding protein YceI